MVELGNVREYVQDLMKDMLLRPYRHREVVGITANVD